MYAKQQTQGKFPLLSRFVFRYFFAHKKLMVVVVLKEKVNANSCNNDGITSYICACDVINEIKCMQRLPVAYIDLVTQKNELKVYIECGIAAEQVEWQFYSCKIEFL